MHGLMQYACYQLCGCSIGFFGPRHREQLSEAKFTRRASASSLLDHTDSEADEDSKSIASMHELYLSKSRPEVSLLTATVHQFESSRV